MIFYSITGEENILPVVAWGLTPRDSYTRPLLMDILIGVTLSRGLNIVSAGEPRDKILLSLMITVENIYSKLNDGTQNISNLYKSSPALPEM